MSMCINDAMINSFYGEYEKPNFYRGSHLTCWNCSEDIREGENYTRLPDYDDDAPGAIICEECSKKTELLESVFNALSDAEKLEVLGMELMAYNG